MGVLEILAALILTVILAGNFLSKKNTKVFTLPKTVSFFVTVIFIYPFFIHYVFLLYRLIYQNSIYPDVFFRIHREGDAHTRSTWGFNLEEGNEGFYIADLIIADYIASSIIYLIIVAFVFVLLFKRDNVRQFCKRRIIGNPPINFKRLLISTVFLTFLIKPFYTYVANPACCAIKRV